MNNSEKYLQIFGHIKNQVENGEITEEQAELINDVAFYKYIEEGCCKEEGDTESDEVIESDDEECEGEECEKPKKTKKKSIKKDKECEECEGEECECDDENCDDEECTPKKKSIKAKKSKKKTIKDKEPDEETESEEDNGEDVPTAEAVMISRLNAKLAIFEAFDNGGLTSKEKDLFLAALS